MSLLDKIERALGRFAIPNITLYFVMGQVLVVLGAIANVVDLNWFRLVPNQVFLGEWWRVVSFMFMPPPFDASNLVSLVFVVFAWYIFYMMGSSLEGFWGTFRYNLFIFLGFALTVGVGFLVPGADVRNVFLAGSVFLAFAYLNPDFEMVLFFILPVKIKWLALIAWVGQGYMFFRGDWSVRFQILAAVGNFLLFFSRDILQTMKWRRRKMKTEAERFATASDEPEPRHRCHVCGKTDISNPELDFRYCSKCAGDQCYCPEHIQNHVHVVVPDDASAR